MLLSSYFFFQAEDGIRDTSVTGVQTCALPISGLPGFTPRELVLIGLIARYHRKGDPDASELGDRERKGDQRRLEVLCGVIRLAEQLERSRDQAVAAVDIAVQDGKVTIEPRADGAGGDTSVAIWSARRNADLLAEAIGKDVEVAG